MANQSSFNSVAQNKRYYEDVYSRYEPKDLVDLCEKYERLLREDKRHIPEAFHHLYFDDLEDRIVGKNILELGFGTGVNALLLARLGASVVAVEIAEASVHLLNEAARRSGVSDRVHAIVGDFSRLDFTSGSFDLVIGKAFLHHLTHEQEHEYLKRSAQLLKSTGEARFVEPAINMPFFGELRFWIPTRDRPSKWTRQAFDTWKSVVDRHPDRDNSSRHFRQVAENFFDDVIIHTWDGLSRFLVFFSPSKPYFWPMRNFLINIDRGLPRVVQYRIARSQTILMRRPKVLGN